MESLDSLLCAEGSESLKSLCLKLLLCLVTVSDSSICFFVKGVNWQQGQIWILEPKVRKERRKKNLYWAITSLCCVCVEGSYLYGLSLPRSCSLEQLLTFLTCTSPGEVLSSGLSDFARLIRSHLEIVFVILNIFICSDFDFIAGSWPVPSSGREGRVLFIYFRWFPFPATAWRLLDHKVLPVHLGNETQETVKQMLLWGYDRNNEKFKDLGSFNLLISYPSSVLSIQARVALGVL